MAEDGRKGEADSERHVVPVKAFKNFKERDPCFGKGFKKPLFLGLRELFGMADKGSMPVKHK